MPQQRETINSNRVSRLWLFDGWIAGLLASWLVHYWRHGLLSIFKCFAFSSASSSSSSLLTKRCFYCKYNIKIISDYNNHKSMWLNTKRSEETHTDLSQIIYHSLGNAFWDENLLKQQKQQLLQNLNNANTILIPGLRKPNDQCPLCPQHFFH